MKGEPWRIKMVEPIPRLSREEREARLEMAELNVFRLSSEDVMIDLLTDSGTGAMSQAQWAALLEGDEAYAGSRSFAALKEAVEAVTGFSHFFPVHQGRGGEKILIPHLVQRRGPYVLGNMHFDTTRAHIELAGGKPLDFLTPEAKDLESLYPFKGNADVEAMEAFIQEVGPNQVALVILTLTCNSVGGQPVSLANAREVARLCRTYDIPFFLDAARFAENAFLVREREKELAEEQIGDIARRFFDLADGFLMSAKKDGLVNMGGLLALREEELYWELAPAVIALEGYLTYGGLSGRDMAALAVGLKEAVDPHHLAQRTGQVRYLAHLLEGEGIPFQKPPGGHGVFVEAGRFLPHLTPEDYPGVALAAALYLEAGVRGVEVGTFMMGRDPETGKERRAPAEFLRLAIPRRVYTDRHMEDVAEGLFHLKRRAPQIPGVKVTQEPHALRHFLASFAWKGT
ncbi:MAG: tryptophanase [Bacillota bacterium]|nr:tryptophanase [Bacillota bacterium]